MIDDRPSTNPPHTDGQAEAGAKGKDDVDDNVDVVEGEEDTVIY